MHAFRTSDLFACRVDSEKESENDDKEDRRVRAEMYLSDRIAKKGGETELTNRKEASNASHQP
jgi:hypothetical protein